MDAKRISEIRERCAKATPGPWANGTQGFTLGQYSFKPVHVGTREIFVGQDDLQFIAASRTDIPDLLAHVEALEAVKTACQLLCDRLRTVHGDPVYMSVWTLSQLHFGPYQGPFYNTELEHAEALLAHLQANAGGKRE